MPTYYGMSTGTITISNSTLNSTSISSTDITFADMTQAATVFPSTATYTTTTTSSSGTGYETMWWNSPPAYRIWFDHQPFVQPQLAPQPFAPQSFAQPRRRAIDVMREREEEARRMEAYRMAAEQEQRRQESYVQGVKDATERALKLLRECLTPVQLEEFDKKKSIPVYTKQGNLYIINHGRAGNVLRFDPQQKKPVEKLCIHPTDYVPDYDTMLTQKLLLESDESEFRRVANITRMGSRIN